MSGTPSYAPQSAEAVAEVLREAQRYAQPLRPCGGGTHADAEPPTRAGCATLALGALDRVIAYDPGDLTLVVEAGATLAAIEAHLAEHGHELALDAEEPERATIGGLLAAGFPTRAEALGRALRDQVIGTRVAQLDGSLTRSGGRVVKNVTGYDLDKLFVGSRGTLAVLVEVALRVHPLPRARRAVAAACASFEEAQELCLRWRDPQPAQLDALDARGAAQVLGATHAELGSPAWLALAGWRGSETVAAGHAEAALRAARILGRTARLLDEEAAARAAAFARTPRRALGSAAGSLVLALAGRPSHASSTARALRSALERAELSREAALWSEAAGLRIRACFPAAPSRERFAALLAALRPAALAAEARVHLEQAPPPLHQELWSAEHRSLLPPHGGLEVMRRLRATFDPLGLLHPGAWPLLDETTTPMPSEDAR